jgi:phytoene synthase
VTKLEDNRKLWPASQRDALDALFGIDRAMGDVLRHTRDPMLAKIKLAWWRERLTELDGGQGPPAEPRLAAVATHLLHRGIRGKDLALLENGWLALLEPFPWTEVTAEAAWLRGRRLFAMAASILSRSGDAIEAAGGVWALADVARHCSDDPSRDRLLSIASAHARALAGTRIPPALRPLSILVLDAINRLRNRSMIGRTAASLSHRSTGIL